MQSSLRRTTSFACVLLLISWMLCPNRMAPQQECIFRVFVTSNLLKHSFLHLVMVEELVTLLNTECCYCLSMTMIKKGNALPLEMDAKR